METENIEQVKPNFSGWYFETPESCAREDAYERARQNDAMRATNERSSAMFETYCYV